MMLARTETTPTRPVMRWHGGKWRLAPFVVKHFPPHRIYVEPYGGAASVLLRKQRSYCEVWNDLDDELVNLFRVIRDNAAELIRIVDATPFARTEFRACYELSSEPVERARRLIARSFMGHGSGAPFRRPTGFRANANASGAHNTAAEWGRYPPALALIVERMRGVVIENRDAVELMRKSDRPDTLHYVDPPYLPDLRSPRSRKGGTMYHAYAHEMSSDDHDHLLGVLRSLTGMVVLSGYPSARYDVALPDWKRVKTQARADRGLKRTECLWLNPLAVLELARRRGRS